MSTLQVKGIDDGLYRALAARAAQDNRSISQEVVTIIQEFLNKPAGDPRQATEQFLALAGAWEDERSAEQVIADIRRSRRRGNRFKIGHVLD